MENTHLPPNKLVPIQENSRCPQSPFSSSTLLILSVRPLQLTVPLKP